jgi:hypothetical protein
MRSRNLTDLDPCNLAAEEIAREFRLCKDGRTLLNRFSGLKTASKKEACLSRAFFMKEKEST